MGYSAPRLDELGLEIPSHLKDYHRNHHGLAEIHDLPCLEDAKKYELVKSVELNRLAEYIEVFPSLTFLVCVRPAGETLASVVDYFTASGLRWPYNPEEATKQLVRIASALPEKFQYVDVNSLPDWYSERIPTRTFTTLNIDNYYKTLTGDGHLHKGVIKSVNFDDLRPKDQPIRKKARKPKNSESDTG
jgi:hypothetical protein